MKKQLIHLAALFVTALLTPLFAGTPKPQIFAVNPSGQFVVTNSITGEAPLQVHVSALVPTTIAQCYWDPTTWRADGQHNLCDLDKSAVSTKNPTNLAKYFSPNSSSLSHPQNVANSNPSACFVPPFDTATTLLNSMISNCIHSHDIDLNAQLSANVLGGGSFYKSSFAWDFGDGQSYSKVSGFNAAHVFNVSGNYFIHLIVTNEAGLSGSISIPVTVVANKKITVLVNSDSDLSGLSSAKAGNRHIVFKAGTTFTLNQSLPLFSNDWIDGNGATLSNSGHTMFIGNGNNILIENLNVVDPGSTMSTVSGSNIAYKNITLNVGKGFDLGATGVLIQNVGNPNWQTNHLTSNFIIATPTGLSMYGNHYYAAKADGNGEPGLRMNGGDLISMIGNQVGGYIGKQDDISLRGSKHVYLGSNEVRGGVINTQIGTSQNPQPSVTLNGFVMENNCLNNITVAIEGGSYGVRYNNNVLNIHPNTDLYNVLYPYQNPIGGEFSASTVSGIKTDEIVIQNNSFGFNNQYGGALRIDAGIQHITQNNNPIGSSMLPCPTPSPSPTPVPTPSPSPIPATITKPITCQSWNFVYTECPSGLQHPLSVSIVKDLSGTYCKPGTYGIKGVNVFVQNGCRMQAAVTGF